MAASRIAGRSPRREVQISFDGSPITAVEGEPAAASLLVADRAILSRSFRFHRPRGLMCSTGQCGWCECEVDGVPSVRTCRVPAREGLVVRSEHAIPSVSFDVLGGLDLVSRLIPPTFYHHRFLRPRLLRKTYLDVIRWFGGRGRLHRRTGSGRAVPPIQRRLSQAQVDVVVVGAGRSGLAAAAAAGRAGARVLVLEADAPPFWAGPASPDVLAGTAAVGWYDGVVAAVGAGASWEIRAGAIVVATGSYERVPTVPDADRPGVLSAALVEILIARHGILPGMRAVLVGADASVGAAGRLLVEAGATVIGPIPTDALLGVIGRRRVWGATIREAGTTRIEQADLVVFGDRVPSVELLLAAGAAARWRSGQLEPVVDDDGRTSVVGLFAVGGAAARHGDHDLATRAGVAAAAHVAAAHAAAAGRPGPWDGEAPRGTRHAGSAAPREVARGRQATSAAGDGDPAPPAAALACFCEDVRVGEVAAEVAAGYADPELLKRRTGALTGPCQGKYCLAAVAAAARAATGAVETEWQPPTARPPLRPVRLGELAGPHPFTGGEG